MKKLDYNDSYAEIRKPIYLESAKILWDKTYELYSCNFEPIDIANLPRGILFCLDKETEFNMDSSLFDIINIYDTNRKISFLNTYFAQLKKVPEGYTPYVPEFLVNNLEIICQSTKLNELMTTFKEVSDRVGKDLLLMINGAYFNESCFLHLSNYAIVKMNKKVIKERGENGIRWRIKSQGPKCWNDEDIVLEDMAFVWAPNAGYSRFLDKNGNWGFLNVISKLMYYMLLQNYNYIGDCAYDRAVFEDKNSGLYGYINHKGIIVIEPKYVHATDFMRLRGICVAVVKYSYVDECKLTKDPERKNIFGDSRDMGITIFKNLITIDINGNLTPDIQKKYEEELNIYKEKIKKEESKKHSLNMFDCESDDDIIDALEGGFGDAFGF